MEKNCGSSGVSRQWIYNYNVNLCPSSDIEQNMYQFGVSWKLIFVFAYIISCFKHRAESGHFVVMKLVYMFTSDFQA